MKRKAIALLSGGLDSSLAVRMMLDQGVEMLAIHFTSPFCNCTPGKAGCRHQARKIAEEFEIPIRVVHKGMDYMRIVQSPPHGYGSGMNPCIDCRIYMLKKVKEMMPGEGASFVVTGEVLGQRPMSQRRQAIHVIEKESGLKGVILRPLSAQHFEPTVPEREGIVDRGKLLAISGRGRKPQIDLAAKLEIRDYPCPAGGCLLTDRVIAARLRDLFIHKPDFDMADLHLLKIGRHIRLNPDLKIVLGRDKGENEKIRIMAGLKHALFHPDNFRGPSAVACGIIDSLSARTIGEIMAGYSKEERAVYRIQKSGLGDAEGLFAVTMKYSTEKLDDLQIR